ncbi:MAG: UPF0262 family protein [Alphaproteobacteria bacterium]|nr:UPF0262 family protein [Alphaproteobacteria bacterium]
MDDRISAIALDEKSVVRRTPAIEQEREVAIADLLEASLFKPRGAVCGPYHLMLSVKENRLVFDISHESGGKVGRILLSLVPFRRIVKDYFLVCDTYYKAIRDASPSQIESLDMGRRGLHNEGTELLINRLNGKIETDFDTARRLFTLICVLHLTV